MTDNRFAQGVITQDLVSVSFEPTNVPEIVNGELTFGGTDASKFSGSLNFVYVPTALSLSSGFATAYPFKCRPPDCSPLTRTSPASLFFGIDQSIRYGTSTNILSSTAGIVDTGTTLLLLPTGASACL